MIGTATATGEPVVVLAIGLVLQAATVPLAAVIAYRLYLGSRQSGSRAMLALAAGLVCLVAVPTIIRFVFPTLLDELQLEVVRELLAGGSELAGLGAILYAIYGQSGRKRTVRKRYEPEPSHALGVVLVVAVLANLSGTAVRIEPGPLATLISQLVSGATALLGAYVAAIGLQGYYRHDSSAMAFLSVGILLVTTVRNVAEFALVTLLGEVAAPALLVTASCYLVGLASIYYSLTRA